MSLLPTMKKQAKKKCQGLYLTIIILTARAKLVKTLQTVVLYPHIFINVVSVCLILGAEDSDHREKRFPSALGGMTSLQKRN